MDTLSIKVWDIMVDNRWHYPAEMEDLLPKHTWASISARVRDFRKLKWNENLVIREARGHGLHRYKLIPRGSAAWHAMDPALLERLLEEQRRRRFHERMDEMLEAIEKAIEFLVAKKPRNALRVLRGSLPDES
jgi:hypothetical protein